MRLYGSGSTLASTYLDGSINRSKNDVCIRTHMSHVSIYIYRYMYMYIYIHTRFGGQDFEICFSKIWLSYRPFKGVIRTERASRLECKVRLSVSEASQGFRPFTVPSKGLENLDAGETQVGGRLGARPPKNIVGPPNCGLLVISLGAAFPSATL